MIASRGLVRDASRVMAATLLILIYCLIQRGGDARRRFHV